YDTQTGKLIWRFYTVPGNPADGPDEAASDEALQRLALPTWHGKWWDLGGGGTVWDSVVYDPKYNQLLIGVGNGAPWNHRIRSDGKGDNLFLSSIVAVDPDTGCYKWHYQANPGDTWDFTNTQQITLATLDIGGRPRDVLMQAPKNGFFYVLDRKDGKLLSADPYVTQTWAERIDLATGRPVEMPGARFEDKPFFNLPSAIGAHAWMPMSYSPKTGLVYIPAMNFPLTYSNADPYEVREGRWNTGVAFTGHDRAPNLPGDPGGKRKAMLSTLKGTLIAWDPVARKARWKVERDWPWNGGTLATAGNLVFQGTVHGDFEAYTADTGRKLWSFQTHRGIVAGPVSYRVGGEQYVAVMAGYGGSMGMASATPFEKRRMPRGMILAFKLGGRGVLPPYTPEPLPPANPSSESFTPEQMARGEKHYSAFCSICHTGPVNPDLRRSAVLGSGEAWKAIVLDGVMESAGMAGFSAYLSAQDAESIRAFVNQKARALKEIEMQ
ncbi:MAG TPA: c-type cytochrome, partial [Alteraurantiacibacter sp.]